MEVIRTKGRPKDSFNKREQTLTQDFDFGGQGGGNSGGSGTIFNQQNNNENPKSTDPDQEKTNEKRIRQKLTPHVDNTQLDIYKPIGLQPIITPKTKDKEFIILNDEQVYDVGNKTIIPNNFGGVELQDCRNLNYLDCVRYKIFRKKYLSNITRVSSLNDFGNMRAKRLHQLNGNSFQGYDYSLAKAQKMNMNDYVLVKKSSVQNMQDSLFRLKKFSDNQSSLIGLLMGQNGQNRDTISKLNSQFRALYKNDSEIQRSFQIVLDEMKLMANIKVPPHHHDMGFDVKKLSNDELADLLKMDRSIFNKKKKTRRKKKSKKRRIKKTKNKISFKKSQKNTSSQGGLSSSLQEKLRKLKENSQSALNRLNNRKNNDSILDNTINIGSEGPSVFASETRSTQTIQSGNQFPSMSENQMISGGQSTQYNSSNTQSNRGGNSNIFNSGFGLQMGEDFNNLDLNNFINDAVANRNSSTGGNSVGNVEIKIEKTTTRSNGNNSS